MFNLYVPYPFVCFDKVVTLALIFLTNGGKWSQLKARGRNALDAQNKEVYTCIILQESWLKACHFSDIDECARNLSCHVNANCTNTIGSHVCTCHTGYTGDGQTCSGDFDNFPSMSRKVLCCSFYTYNPSYSKREIIWNVFLAQIKRPEVVNHLSWNSSPIKNCGLFCFFPYPLRLDLQYFG